MATRDIVFGSTNTDKEIDVIDIAAVILVPYMASLLFGVMSWDIQVFGGYDFTAPLWTVLGASISVAFLVSTFGVVWIVGTNVMNQKTEMGRYEFGAVVTALGLPVLFVLIPSVETAVMWNDYTKIAASLYVAGAATYVSFEG